MLKYKKFILPAALFMFICWIIFMADAGQSSIFFTIVKKHRDADKLGHALLYGLLTFFLNIALEYKRVGIGWLRVQLGAVLVLVFAVLEELSQWYFPNRTPDLKDIIAGVVGITVFTLLSRAYGYIIKHFSKKHE